MLHLFSFALDTCKVAGIRAMAIQEDPFPRLTSYFLGWWISSESQPLVLDFVVPLIHQAFILEFFIISIGLKEMFGRNFFDDLIFSPFCLYEIFIIFFFFLPYFLCMEIIIIGQKRKGVFI